MRTIKGRDRQQVKQSEADIHDQHIDQNHPVDIEWKKQIPDKKSRQQCHCNIGEGPCEGHEDNAFPDIFKVSGIYGNGLGPSEVEKKEADCPERVYMGQWIECKPAHLFCRWISKPQGGPAVGVFMDGDGK